MLQHLLHQGANRLLVIHHQYPASAPTQPGNAFWVWQMVCASSGQVDMKRGARPRLRGNRNVTIVPFNNRIGSSKAKTAASGLGGKVRVKNLGQMFLWNASAMILHADLEIPPRLYG